MIRRVRLLWTIFMICSLDIYEKTSRERAEVRLTFNPRSYLRAFDASPAVLEFCMAILYMDILSSRVC